MSSELTKAHSCRNNGKIKVKKKIGKKALAKRLMEEWSLKVKELANFKCEKCGSTEYLNSHHIFGRKNKSVRYDVDNGCCLCAGHHKFKTDFSAHETPLLFTHFIIDKRGQEWYEVLRLKARSIKSE
jgi:predicted restriction endonuclease